MQHGHDARNSFADIAPHQLRRNPQHAIPEPTEVKFPARIRSAPQFMRPIIKRIQPSQLAFVHGTWSAACANASSSDNTRTVNSSQPAVRYPIRAQRSEAE